MKILMVCLGNICRSPLAEGIMKKKLQDFEVEAYVDSAGTASYHTGEKPDIRSIAVAIKNGIDISSQKARKFEVRDFNNFDMIFAMDENNYHDIVRQARDKKDIEKVKMILNILYPGKNKPVPDPYYGGDGGFDKVFAMLEKACEKVASDLAANKVK
jgi:protein-tyrosine phosphatase